VICTLEISKNLLCNIQMVLLQTLHEPGNQTNNKDNVRPLWVKQLRLPTSCMYIVASTFEETHYLINFTPNWNKVEQATIFHLESLSRANAYFDWQIKILSSNCINLMQRKKCSKSKYVISNVFFDFSFKLIIKVPLPLMIIKWSTYKEISKTSSFTWNT